MASRYRIRKYKRLRRQRRRKENPFRVWAIRLGKGGLSLATLASLVLLGHTAYKYFQQAEPFTVGEVRIMGCMNILESELLDKAQVDFRSSLVKLDLQEISRRLARHPWVEKAQVRRDLSRQALVIEIKERVARALILLDELYLIDRQGEVFKKAEPKEKMDLPILTGITMKEWKAKDAGARELIQQALEMMDVLDERAGFSIREISEIHLSKKHGLTLYTLDGGIPIRMGRGEYPDKFNRLEKVLPDLRSKMDRVESLNLTIPKRVVVKTKETRQKKT